MSTSAVNDCRYPRCKYRCPRIPVLLQWRRLSYRPHSSDDWGLRWNEDSLFSEKYLVKRRERKPAPVPETKFYAFFREEIQEYKVHIGVNDKGTPDQSFVVVDGPFGGESPTQADLRNYQR